MITVTAAIIKQGNQVLITRRAPHKHLGGYWEFPGGKIEEGETPEACLKRELQEELGIHVEVGNFFMENKYHYEEMTILLKAYHCKIISGEINLTEHDQFEWVNAEDFDNYQFAPADIPFIKALSQTKSHA